MLDAEAKAAVLRYVRAAIAAEFGGPEPLLPDDAVLAAPGACFVTLSCRGNGELRGCIGNLQAFEPLADNLRRNAVNAAIGDPRFPALEPGELDEVRIEVSVLSEPRSIAAVADFEPGRDGIILQLNGRQAVFLPQVASEQGWDRETTLSCLARKAGLPVDAWRDPACRFWVFTAEVFGEEAGEPVSF